MGNEDLNSGPRGYEAGVLTHWVITPDTCYCFESGFHYGSQVATTMYLKGCWNKLRLLGNSEDVNTEHEQASPEQAFPFSACGFAEIGTNSFVFLMSN